ncbi:MAG: type II secretion system protein [Cellulomonas sp.]
MNARIRATMDKRARGEKGFTLIELLVVVIIIGILAAIAIPAFLKQREKAWAAQVVSDVKNSSTAAEAFATEHDGLYTGMDLQALKDNGYNVTAGVTVAPTPKDANKSYTLKGTSSKVAGVWTFDSVTGITTKTAS